jgi:hypothetical protein
MERRSDLEGRSKPMIRLVISVTLDFEIGPLRVRFDGMTAVTLNVKRLLCDNDFGS